MSFKLYCYIRVAEVGRLSANAKNAFNSFVGRVFANSRQKTLFFRVLPKLQQKGSFYLVLPSFYLVLPSFTQFLPSFTQFLLVLPSFYLVLPSFYLVFTRQGLKFSSESKLFGERRSRNSCHPVVIVIVIGGIFLVAPMDQSEVIVCHHSLVNHQSINAATLILSMAVIIDDTNERQSNQLQLCSLCLMFKCILSAAMDQIP